MKKLISFLILALFLTQSVMAAPFNANAKTKRITAGTKFELKLMNPLSTSTNIEGQEFQAILLTDQTQDNDVILPMGSLIRGSIKKIVPSKKLSRGAILYLDFDHIVTPNGRQIPLSLSIVGRSDMTYDGGIAASQGYKQAVKENWDKTVDITKTATEWGNETFEDFAGGWFRVLTVPVSAVAGGLAGGFYTVGADVYALFARGKDVNLKCNEKINVILVEPIDIPVI
ncbi:MAG: hypothetical protein NC390_00245 [Fusobacterium sp.]|nr:hypothetical protein [Fusobacterium sp.]